MPSISECLVSEILGLVVSVGERTLTRLELGSGTLKGLVSEDSHKSSWGKIVGAVGWVCITKIKARKDCGVLHERVWNLHENFSRLLLSWGFLTNSGQLYVSKWILPLPDLIDTTARKEPEKQSFTVPEVEV